MYSSSFISLFNIYNTPPCDCYGNIISMYISMYLPHVWVTKSLVLLRSFILVAHTNRQGLAWWKQTTSTASWSITNPLTMFAPLQGKCSIYWDIPHLGMVVTFVTLGGGLLMKNEVEWYLVLLACHFEITNGLLRGQYLIKKWGYNTSICPKMLNQ